MTCGMAGSQCLCGISVVKLVIIPSLAYTAVDGRRTAILLEIPSRFQEASKRLKN